jgi:hypothetical protein
MEDHFKPEFDWKTKCKYDEHFVNTERTYFTVSFGFEVDLYIPFKTFQNMDKNIHEYKTASGFIEAIASSYQFLLD